MTTLTKYQNGVIDICDSLVTDLLKFLKDEGRYKYRMIRYMKEITDSFENIYDNQTDEDIDTYERILYLMRKSIEIDYHRLRIRKLSPADSVICIITKLLSFLPEEILPNVRGLFQGFYENIKNKAKLDKLVRTETTLKEAIKNEELGKRKASDIGLYQIEHPEPKTHEITGESQTWGRTSGKEIEL